MKIDTTDILMRPTLRYAGVSHVQQADPESPSPEQVIYLLLDKNRHQRTGNPIPHLSAKAKNPTLLREIFIAFFGAVQKGLLYKPSAEAAKAAEHMSSLMRTRSSYTTAEYHQRMYEIMSTMDEKGFALIDPILTIHNGYCYFEVFDKRAKRSLTLTLEPSMWEDGFTSQNGTARLSFTPEFVQGLHALSARFTLNVQVGDNVGDESTADWKADIVKRFSVDLQWLRGALMLQAVGALKLHDVDLVRINLFNMLRTLRMRKPKTHRSFESLKEANSLRFLLVPGQQPALVLDPWGLEIACSGESYQGTKKREILMFGERRDMLFFDRFLPYLKEASFSLFDSALHVCLDIQGDGFRCSMVLQGFSGKNWYRRLQMETMLPRFANKEDTSFFEHLQQEGTYLLSGEESLVEKKSYSSAIIRGEALFLPTEQTFVRRSLFAETLDMGRLHVLGEADTMARDHLRAGRVDMKTEYHSNGNLVFKGSRVTEALREGEVEAFVAEPRFELRPDGRLAKVGCTCAVWDSKKERGYGGPCSHLRALWLNYCQEIESLREAKDRGEDTGPVLQEERTFCKKEEERIVEFDLRTKYLFIERWRTGETGSYRRTIQVYPNEAAVRLAFEKRCSTLLRRGFEQNEHTMQ